MVEDAPTLGATVALDGSGSSHASGTIDEYRWWYGDGLGGFKLATGVSPEIHLIAGLHNVQLNAVGSDGKSSNDVVTIRVDGVTECNDGTDNDGDGLVDHPDDPGCGDPEWALEDPECDDDVDNDGDGKIDWDGGSGGGSPDPHCSGGSDSREQGSGGSCGLGFEIVLALGSLALVRRRRRRIV